MTNPTQQEEVPNHPEHLDEPNFIAEILAFQIYDTAYSALKGQKKLSVDQATGAILTWVEKDVIGQPLKRIPLVTSQRAVSYTEYVPESYETIKRQLERLRAVRQEGENE
jgi:hypothetical protein